MSERPDVRALLRYDSETGHFTWLRDWYSVRQGDRAGNTNAHGYVVIGIFGRDVYAHRLAWEFATGEPPKHGIDHIDGNRSNNALGNLRDIPQAINAQNRRKAVPGSFSGLIGVYYRKDISKWASKIVTNGVGTSLGVFDTKEAAQAKYIEAKRRMHPGGTL